MHDLLFKELSVHTFLMQFYCWLARGFFSEDEIKVFYKLNDDNVGKLAQMKDPMGWDGDYGQVMALSEQTVKLTTKARGFLSYKQICTDGLIAEYVRKNPGFFRNGIDLKALQDLLDISVLFRNGYMLHDVFWGYPEKDMYSFQIDCVDYIYSAAHFYNEGYEHFTNKRQIRLYNEIPPNEIGRFEFTRIQSRDEVMFRNFREAYINILLFIESFINSVGFDGFLKGKASSPADGLKLKGIQGTRKNGRYNYSTMANKMEDISRVLGGKPIDTAKEPFASYLAVDVELRNAYVHSSPSKPKPRFSPGDWKNKCDEMIKFKCELILDAFWKACYPREPFPAVIFNEFHGNSFKGIQHKMVAMRQ